MGNGRETCFWHDCAKLATTIVRFPSISWNGEPYLEKWSYCKPHAEMVILRPKQTGAYIEASADG
jgi:hypothetical protein